MRKIIRPAHAAPIDTPENNTLAARTIESAKAGMQSGRSSCLPELVQLIQALSAKAREISVTDLAEIVQKHVTVMAKVIAVANTLGYNPSGIEISTVAQAIQVVGFERIRSLVTSLILVHDAVDANAAVDQRDSAMLALCSGLVAQQVSRDRGAPDPEQAFVAGSLRNFGRLLLATYLTDQFREAQQHADGKLSDEAYREIFGLTALELGYELLQSTSLPAGVLDALREFSPQTFALVGPDSASLLIVSEFAVKLCELAMDRELTTEGFNGKIRELLDRFEPHLTFTPEGVASVMTATGERMAEFMQSLGISSFGHEVVEVFRWRAGGKPVAARPPAAVPPTPRSTPVREESPARNTRHAKVVSPAVPAETATTRPREKTPAAPLPADDTPALAPQIEIKQDSWHEGVDLLARCLEEPRPDFAKIQRLALEHVQQGFGAPEAVLLSLDSDHRNYVATLGQGKLIRYIRGDRAVRRDERTVFGICLSRRDNVVIHNTTDPRIAPYLPAWCAGKNGLGAFVAMPLHDHKQCFALIIVGWPEPHKIVITPEHSKLLHSLLLMVSTAHRQSAGK
ncbi:MAG TPA: HDOD domain-containing protein [Opitutaceae bacterium]|nr:HDOD domain-containing protein [Opitutaceae bacterium]